MERRRFLSILAAAPLLPRLSLPEQAVVSHRYVLDLTAGVYYVFRKTDEGVRWVKVSLSGSSQAVDVKA